MGMSVPEARRLVEGPEIYSPEWWLEKLRSALVSVHKNKQHKEHVFANQPPRDAAMTWEYTRSGYGVERDVASDVDTALMMLRKTMPDVEKLRRDMEREIEVEHGPIRKREDIIATMKTSAQVAMSEDARKKALTKLFTTNGAYKSLSKTEVRALVFISMNDDLRKRMFVDYYAIGGAAGNLTDAKSISVVDKLEKLGFVQKKILDLSGIRKKSFERTPQERERQRSVR